MEKATIGANTKKDIAETGDCVLMAYGSGGVMMHELIEKMFIDSYGSDILSRGDDAAVLSLPANGRFRLAFTSDSFVVSPHFFAGGDIGRLAVCGTVNDLATSGAQALWMSVAFILEEGFELTKLQKICASIAEAAQEARIKIVTGDTKVVERGHGDGIFINTSGVGLISGDIELSGANCCPGDKVIVSGSMGDHGIAIICAREQLALNTSVASDAAPLNHMVASVLAAAPACHCFRDPTRGGLASTLNELALQSAVRIVIDEEKIPVKDQVRAVCDMLGFDYLQVANEGKMVCVVAADQAQAALSAMQACEYGKDAAIIGDVCAPEDEDELGAGLNGVFVRNALGATRVLDMLTGEQLPRIC